MKFLRSLILLILLQVLLNAPYVQAASKKVFKLKSLSKTETIQIVSKLTTVLDGYSGNLIGTNHLKAEKIVNTWGWDDFKDWCSDSYNKTKDWAKDTYEKGKDWAKGENKATKAHSRLNYNGAKKIVKAWGWDDFKDWCSDSYNKTKEWAKDSYEKGKDWAVSQALIKEKIMKVVKAKADGDLTDKELQQVERDLEMLGPLFKALMEWGINYYYVVKLEVKHQIELYYDAKGVTYGNLLFEKFEVGYIQQVLEEVRPIYEILYITEGKEAVEEIEQELLLTYGFYLEAAAVEEIEGFFDSIYQTQLLKQMRTLKQEGAQNLTYDERLENIYWTLWIDFESDPQAYKLAKDEVLQSIEQDFGSTQADQARTEIGNYEVYYVISKFEERRLQYEVAAIFGFTKELQAIEQSTADFLAVAFEPVAIEALRNLFAQIYQEQKADTLQEAFVQAEPYLKQLLDSWRASDYRDLKEGILGGVQHYYGDEGYAQAKKAILDLEVEWVKEFFEQNGYWVESNLEQNGVKRHQEMKQSFVQHFTDSLEPEAIEAAEEFFDSYTEELYEALEEVRPYFEEALDMGIEVYGELKRVTLEQVEQEQPELYGKTKLLFATFEIEYLTEKFEELRPLLAFALILGGRAEVEKIEQEFLSQVQDVFDYNAIIEIEIFFDSIYELEQTISQDGVTNSSEFNGNPLYQMKKLKQINLFKQEEEDESCDNDECDNEECDADECADEEDDFEEEEEEQNLQVELLKAIKKIQKSKQSEEDSAYDNDELDFDELDADELDADGLDADELDADEEVVADLQVELLRKLKTLSLLQQEETEDVFDADELDADSLDADGLDADELDADEEVVADLQVELLRKLKTLSLLQQEETEDVFDADELDADGLDADELDADELDADELDADEEVVADLQVELLRKLKTLSLLQQEETEDVFDADSLDADGLDADELDADELDADEEVVADFEVQLLRRLKNLHLFKQEDEDTEEDFDSLDFDEEEESFTSSLELSLIKKIKSLIVFKQDHDESDFDSTDADESDFDEVSSDEFVSDEVSESQVLLIKELKSGTQIITPSVEMQSPSFIYYISLIGIISLIVVGLCLLAKRGKQTFVKSKGNNVYKLFKKEKEIEEHLL